ncbi:TIGR03757 family integrating conjugative element protein [Xenorhabdus khoisanae]|uniref:TIGR03757 family integrating conjugative element protein n=1 Tax=Xenorhabdus khoisanae TaxID=880157 RepID=UPI00235A3F07|nr:TIGR03757 family integrating conjugative element protein [Xenorhabdus khoisanae]MDC9612906.1 TIGR03757 family integrating conjugative element protein [Xenorhabdus khoisanae]
MKKRYILASFVLMVLTSATQAATVIYTDHQKPPDKIESHEDVQVVWLDAPDVLQAEWMHSMNVPVNADNAPLIAELLQSPEWHEKEREMIKAYQGIIRAWELGIKRYPAIVIDDRYVIYGSTDITQAKSWVEQYRGEKNEW